MGLHGRERKELKQVCFYEFHHERPQYTSAHLTYVLLFQYRAQL